MKRVTTTFTLPCTAETFWSVFLDPAYTRAFYLDELHFKGLRVLESGETTRKLHITPRLNLPGPIARLVGDSFAYEEHGTLDRKTDTWSWRMVRPAGVGSSQKDLISTSGTTRIAPGGAGQCRRTDDVTVEAHVFGLGGVIESIVEKEMHSSWAREKAFFERWLHKAP